MIRSLAALLATLALSGALEAVAAPLDKLVGQTVRANYGALHGCFRKALAQDRSRGGTLFVTVTLGAADSVHSVRVEKDGLGHKGASACIINWVRGWTFRGAAAAGAGMRSEITIPLTFRAGPRQFAVRLEDSPPASGAALKRRALLTPKNSGASAATMTWIKVGGAAAVPPARADRVLYVLRGKGRYKASTHRRALRTGAALWAPGQAPLELDGALEGILVEAPHAALSAGESTRRPVVARPGRSGDRIKGTRKIWPLLAHRRLKHKRIYAGLIALARGEHAFPTIGQAELLYLLKGTAELTLVDGTTQRVAAGHAVYLPPGTGYRIRVDSALRALQIFTPAGPEQRYLRTSKRGRR
jgi:quercetin dioxygenase-like cupin family protein